MLAIVLIGVEVLCCSLLRGTWNIGGVSYSGLTSARMLSYIVSAALGAIVLATALLVKPLQKSAVFISGVALVFVIVYIALFAVTEHGPLGSFITSTYSVLLVVLFALLAFRVARTGTGVLSCTGIFTAVFACISLVAYSLVPFLHDYDTWNATWLAMPVALASALVIAVGACIAMLLRLRFQAKEVERILGKDASGIWSLEEIPELVRKDDEASSEHLRIERATEQFDLTQREADIVACFARGRTIKQTADELCLSPGTVKWYSKSIYSKLGVHSKAEISDLLDTLL